MFHTTRSVTGITSKRTRPLDQTIYGYEAPQADDAMPRDVQKWLQSLNLTVTIKNPRRDFANGYLAAQIFERYYPSEIKLNLYSNGTSTHTRRDNWGQLHRLCKKLGDRKLPEKMVEATVQQAPGSAMQLLIYMYEMFTGKRLRRWGDVKEEDLDVPLTTPEERETRDREAAFDEGAAVLKQDFEERVIAAPLQSDVVSMQFGTPMTKPVGDASQVRKKFGNSPPPEPA